MEAFYGNSRFADFVFIFPSSQLPAHRIVLASHSDYFKRLLCKRKDLSPSDAIIVGTTHDEDDVRAVIEWMYRSSTISGWNRNQLQQRLALAQKYQMERLTDEIFRRLL